MSSRLYEVPESDIIYEKENFVVLKDTHSYTVWNRKYPYQARHCHINDLGEAKRLCHFAYAGRTPINLFFRENFMRLI